MPAVKKQQKPKPSTKEPSTKEASVKSDPSHQVVLSKNAGGNISDYSVEFTKDSKYLFCCVGSTIKIYSMATGAVVKILSQLTTAGGHENKVTRVILNPKNPMQLYSASLDGTIKLWDYNDDILLKTFTINKPIQHMVMSDKSPDQAYIVVKGQNTQDQVYCYTFENSSQATSLRLIGDVKDCSTIDISKDGEWIAFGGRYKAYLWNVNNDDMDDVPESQLKMHSFTEKVTVLKFNPERPVVSIGDRAGRITQITNYHLEDEHIVKSILHWHHLPVRCLSYMADGSYLLSGGEETVLVIWQLDTGHKQFLPHLGEKIAFISISPNHRFYCISLDDNSIRFVNTISQNVEQVIQGLQYAQANDTRNPLSTGLVIEPRNHHVVLNGIPGNIQFYDANADSHVMDLEVVPMNRISRAGEKEMVEPHVDHVAFLRTGEWMATVDKRDDQVTTPELFLKFWRWDPDTQAYKLHTRVDYPHTKPITSILFNPNTRQGPMAITTSLDKTFKVWGLNAGRKDGEDAWMCRSVGVYRDDVPSTASFSEDGGILAVGFGQLITLWDPYLNSIQGVLAQPQSEVIETVHFFGDGHPFLIAKTKKHLYVWNILTCKVSWCYKMSVDLLVVDTASGQFVVVTNTNTDSSRLVVFDVKSPIPTAIHYLDYKCLSIAWLPKEQEDETGFSSSSSLLTFTSKHDLVVYNIKSSQQKKQQTKAKINNEPLAEASSESSSMLDGIYGKRLAERETDEQQRLRLQTAQSMRDEAMANTRKEVKGRHRLDGDGSVLSAPSHVLPSVDSVFDTFMSSIMSLRIVEEANDIEQEAMDVDQDDSINQNEQSEQTEVHVVNRANVDLPSLSTYFQQQQNENKSQVQQKTPVVAAESTDESDDSDQEDPSNIDW